jgi:small subunit ribosomal protein S14
MARKALIQKEKKRIGLVKKYQSKRANLKHKLKTCESFKQKVDVSFELQALPRNSAPTRLTNRCTQTGRSNGFYRDFGVCRHVVRDMANTGVLPGVTKSSW